jgi:hypothetical protein
VLLAAELNRRMEELLHGDTRWLPGRRLSPAPSAAVGAASPARRKRPSSKRLNDWMEAQGLPRGVVAYDFADPGPGEQKAVFDLAWPNGIQEELSQPVAVLLNEEQRHDHAGQPGWLPLLHEHPTISSATWLYEILGEAAAA